MSCCNNCGSGCSPSRSRKIIIWGALLTLLLNEALTDDGKQLVGGLLTSVGDLLITAQTADTVCTVQKRNNDFL